MPRPDCTWCAVLPRLAGRAPAAVLRPGGPAAPQPRGPAFPQPRGPAAPRPCSPAVCKGAGRLRRRRGRGGGGSWPLLAVGRHFLLLHSVESPPSSSACPQRPKGPGRAWGITGGGSRRAGSGQVHTAVLCSGMGGGLGAAQGCRLVALETRRGLEWGGGGRPVCPPRPSLC